MKLSGFFFLLKFFCFTDEIFHDSSELFQGYFCTDKSTRQDAMYYILVTHVNLVSIFKPAVFLQVVVAAVHICLSLVSSLWPAWLVYLGSVMRIGVNRNTVI